MLESSTPQLRHFTTDQLLHHPLSYSLQALNSVPDQPHIPNHLLLLQRMKTTSMKTTSINSTKQAFRRCSVASRSSLKVNAVAAPERVSTRAQRPDNTGRFGKFGGKYVPETLMPALAQLEEDYKSAMADPAYHVSGPSCVVCNSTLSSLFSCKRDSAPLVMGLLRVPEELWTAGCRVINACIYDIRLLLCLQHSHEHCHVIRCRY